ncbi:MAG: methyltransferase domain-containing protein [Micavibrio sp.]
MNRKDRRIQEKMKSKATPAQSSAATSQARAEALKAQGLALKSAGRDKLAVDNFLEALKCDPSLADVHFTIAIMARTKPALKIDMDEINAQIKNKASLCKSYLVILNILKSKKQYQEAQICQEELCRLMPDNIDEKANLALLYNLDCKREMALRTLAEIMKDHPEQKQYKGLFLSLMGPVSLQKDDPELKAALESCFENIYEANLAKAYPVWISLIMNDANCSDLKQCERLFSQKDFDEWADHHKIEDLNFIKDSFFLDGLRLLILTDVVLEQFLTRLRRWICLNILELEQSNRLNNLEHFICALGEQCFLNEYIMSQSVDETRAIERMITRIKNDKLSDTEKRHLYQVISMYQPLVDIAESEDAEFLSLSTNNPSFKNLVSIQYDAPMEERRIKSTLEQFGTIGDEVSQNVQQQYEEHPYPRWNSINNYPSPNDDIPMPIEQRHKPYNILVAGCGTGRHAIGTAACYPHAKVTAIDLSRSSLAYAQRKAREAGLADRIRFIHADILDMKDWQGQFDIIESSGVLHHMDDPFKGWQTLNNLLVKGGFFKVGLYSALAREQIVEARNFVANGKYPSTDDGIRQCRDDILALPTSNPMRKKLISFTDFFSTSLLRDLIFHVQEHRMTLPQIKEMMDRLGLECHCINMTIPEIVTRFDKMFPEDANRSNLLNWHEFETKFPETFSGMYQFWSRKI